VPSNKVDLLASDIFTKFASNCLHERNLILGFCLENLYSVLAINNNEPLERGEEDFVARIGPAPKGAFVDLSSKRTIALLTRLDNVQDRNLEVVRDLEFDFSEGTLACDSGTR
jgi:hypothetical protein